MSKAWSTMVLGDVATIQTGRSNSQDAVPDGPFPLFDRSREPKRSNRCLHDCEAVIVPGEGREFVPRYYDGPFDLHQRVYALTAFKEVDGRFLYYVLTALRAYFAQVATGATVKSLRKGMFERLAFRAPDLRTQSKIAAILYAYDELIENGRRRVEILEEMGRNLYREWFVEFRFPDHGRVRFVDSSLGPVPEGWTPMALGDVCAVMSSGGTPARTDDESWRLGEFDWYKTKELEDSLLQDSEERINRVAFSRSSARLFERGTILMAIYGSPTVGRLGVLTRRASCNQAALGMVADSEFLSQEYLFYCLHRMRGHFNAIAQGAAQQNISKEKVASTPCLVPPKPLMEEFSAYVGAIWDTVENHLARNRTLTCSRDVLLRRLVSGELDVADLPVRTAPPSGGNGDHADIVRYDFFRQITVLPFVDKVVLFGSRARDDHEEHSDIDLAVFCDDASDDEWLEVLECLSTDRTDTLLKVDCIRFDRCDAVLQENVLAEGVVLYDKEGRR